MSPQRRPPYWTLVAFVALIALPAPWFSLALGAIATTSLALRVARARAHRRAVGAVQNEEGVLLGRDRTGRPLQVTGQELAAHGLIVGASGAGKSTTLLRILTHRIERDLPVVAVDMKGSPNFARALAASAARAGRPFLVWTPDGPTHWNPLAHGNPTELKDKLVSSERFTEPHYQRAAERYLQTILGVLGAVHPERPSTLHEVVALTSPHRLATALRSVGEPLRERVLDYIASLTPDQVSAVRGMATRLALLTESHTGRFLAEAAPGEPSVDLLGALRGEAVVLFSLNSSRYGHLAAQLGTIVVQDLVSAAGERLAAAAVGSPAQATVAIDEFSALGADHLLGLFARGRESRIGVLVATQEFADLDRAARGLLEQVVGNTAVKLVHRQDVPASAQMVARMIGTEWVWEETRQFGGSLRGGFGPRGTRRRVERYRTHPNDIMSLRVGEAAVIGKLPSARVQLGFVDPPATSESPASPAPRAMRESPASPAPRARPSTPRPGARARGERGQSSDPPAAKRPASRRVRPGVPAAHPRRRPPPERNGPER